MSAKNFRQILFKLTDLTPLGTAKRYLCILLMFAVAGSLVPIFSIQKIQRRLWLSNSSVSISRSRLLGSLIQKKCIIFEDSFTVKDSKKSFKQFSAQGLGFLARNLDSYSSTIFDRVEYSPHIAFFALFSLRSPPLFS